MAPFPLLPIVRADIRDALAYTLERYGIVKARDYAALTREALRELVRDPQCGRRRPEVHPDAWVYPIRKPGRDARHLFLYEIVEGQAQIYGFLYDARDLPAHWSSRRPT